MGCSQEFENCFCFSMGTNISDNYDVALNFKDGQYFLDVKDDILGRAITEAKAPETDVVPDYVTENKISVHIPENLSSAIAKSHVWDEYDKRCIKCGRCTLVCPTCTCWCPCRMYSSRKIIKPAKRLFLSAALRIIPWISQSVKSAA